MNISLLHLVYSVLLPDTCTLCDSKTNTDLDICEACFKQLPHNHLCCKTCALPLPASLSAEHKPLLCGNCLANPCTFDFATIPYLYRPPADFMVQQLKFKGERKFARLMGELVANSLDKSDLPDLIIPVPQHTDRFIERGFNHAANLANVIGKRLRTSVDEGIARRVKAGKSQAGLTARERRMNVRGAFEVAQFSGIHHIAIVDDVLTTGATCQSLAMELKKQGCHKVSVWAFARTP